MKKSTQNQTVICRPCKEQNNWEIQAPDGHVYSKHYSTKSECMKAGKDYAAEFGADLQIEDLKNASKQTKSMHAKRTGKLNNEKNS